MKKMASGSGQSVHKLCNTKKDKEKRWQKQNTIFAHANCNNTI